MNKVAHGPLRIRYVCPTGAGLCVKARIYPHSWLRSRLALSLILIVALTQTPSARAQNMNPKSLCASKLTAFIAELDELLPVAPTSQPINDAIQRSFPLYGCDIDEALRISQQSRYFDRFERHEKYVIVIFDHTSFVAVYNLFFGPHVLK